MMIRKVAAVRRWERQGKDRPMEDKGRSARIRAETLKKKKGAHDGAHSGIIIIVVVVVASLS